MRVATPVVLCALTTAAASAAIAASVETRALNVHIKVSNGVAATTASVDKPAEINFGGLDFDSDSDDDDSEKEYAGEEAGTTSTNTTSTAASTTPTTNPTTTTTSVKIVGKQKCSAMNKYSWTDFMYVCAWFHADTGYNIYYRRKDNASFVYECECNQNIEETYGVFSATKWTWKKSGAVDCFSRYGKDVANVVALFDDAPVCKNTNKKFCDTKTTCTYW